MADTGVVYPSTSVGNRTISGGTVDWSSASNIEAKDSTYASASLAFNLTRGLAGSNYDFSGIPAGSTIDGIEGILGTYGLGGPSSIPVSDFRLILADGSDGSENKEDEMSDWTSTYGTDTAGGASDLWGETIALSDVQDADWGLFVGADGSAGLVTVDVDSIAMKIYYTESAPKPKRRMTGLFFG